MHHLPSAPTHHSLGTDCEPAPRLRLGRDKTSSVPLLAEHLELVSNARMSTATVTSTSNGRDSHPPHTHASLAGSTDAKRRSRCRTPWAIGARRGGASGMPPGPRAAARAEPAGSSLPRNSDTGRGKPDGSCPRHSTASPVPPRRQPGSGHGLLTFPPRGRRRPLPPSAPPRTPCPSACTTTKRRTSCLANVRATVAVTDEMGEQATSHDQYEERRHDTQLGCRRPSLDGQPPLLGEGA